MPLLDIRNLSVEFSTRAGKFRAVDGIDLTVDEGRPWPEQLRAFLSAPPGLGPAERVFYAGLSAAAELLVSPSAAPFAGVPGWAVRGLAEHGQLAVTRAQLRALPVVLGPRSPSEGALPITPRPTARSNSPIERS